MSKLPIISAHDIENRIYLIRGHRVMLDSDLAKLYGAETKYLNKAVKRNPKRFPDDLMFQLTVKEAESLRFQIGTLKSGRGQHRKYLPFVFTEQGVAMLSSVLNSDRAIMVNLTIMRAFVRIRQVLGTQHEAAKRLDELERHVGVHDEHIKAIFEALRRLIETPHPPRRKIGF